MADPQTTMPTTNMRVCRCGVTYDAGPHVMATCGWCDDSPIWAVGIDPALGPDVEGVVWFKRQPDGSFRAQEWTMNELISEAVEAINNGQ